MRGQGKGTGTVRKTTFIAVTMVVLLFGHWAQAGVSVIMNGSFENDACSIYDITAVPPYRWDDINLPEGKFGGYVDTDWSSHGDYSLTLYSEAFGTFEANDTATVSQQVYLTDVITITFNVQLSTDWWPGIRWDPNKFSAVLLIDGDVVWDSNNSEPDENDEYREQTWPVDEKYKDGSLHTLSLGIKANAVQETPSYIFYIARWDFVRFDTHCDCGGFDYPPGDFNRDCSVDWLDFEMMFDQWLDPEPDEKYDLFPDDNNIFNFHDFAVFANVWVTGGFEQENILLYGDLNNDGIVNLKDLAITAEDWDSEEADLYDILTLAEEWLEKNWLYGLE